MSERAIWLAALAGEEAGAHPYLTDAVTLLAQAREKVADYVDLQQSNGGEAPGS